MCRLQERRQKSRKTVLASTIGEGDLCSSEAKSEGRTERRVKILHRLRQGTLLGFCECGDELYGSCATELVS